MSEKVEKLRSRARACTVTGNHAMAAEFTGYADEIDRLRAACRKAADIIDRNNGRQAEKVADAASILRDALA